MATATSLAVWLESLAMQAEVVMTSSAEATACYEVAISADGEAAARFGNVIDNAGTLTQLHQWHLYRTFEKGSVWPGFSAKFAARTIPIVAFSSSTVP